MIEQVIELRRHSLGGGLNVGRVLPAEHQRMVGPFVFFDHMLPLDLPKGIDRSVDVRPHPHIGLATVTYLFSGEVMHRDSLGYEEAIRPHEVNWMTAGSGITHSERFEHARATGDHLHGVQAWVALPDGQEEIDPSFSHHAGDELPHWQEGGVAGRLVAGNAYGLQSAARTLSPLHYVHLDMAAGASAELPHDHRERALYVAAGSVEVGNQRFGVGRMVVLGRAASRVRAIGPSVVMLLGGEPVGERYIYWNFVSSSKDRLAQAASDWRAGRMKLPDADHDEFIALAQEPALLAPTERNEDLQ